MANPLVESRPVWTEFVSAFVLSPGEVTTDEFAHGRHRVGEIISRRAEPLRAEQFVHRGREHRRHEAAARVDPFRITAFDDAVADETRSRRAERDELMRIHGQVRRGGGRLTSIIASRHCMSRVEILGRRGHLVTGMWVRGTRRG